MHSKWVWTLKHALAQHTIEKVPKHFLYIQYGCRIQSGACCSLNHDIATSLGLRSTPKTPKSTAPKSTPDLHRPNTVRVDTYAHTQNIKVPKHFVHIQSGCGIQSEACCSLNHDISKSLGFRSAPQNPQNLPPTCIGVTV